MTTHRFTWAWLIVLAALFVMGFAFPFVLRPLVLATGCQGIGGACGAAAVLIGILVRLPLALAGGIALTVLAWRRARALGLPRWLPALVGWAYLAALPAVFSFGNYWGASFSLGGGLAGPSPLPLTYVVLGLAALSLLPPGCGIAPRTRDARRLSAALATAAMLLLLPLAIRSLTMLPFVGFLFQPIAFSRTLFLVSTTGGLLGRLIGMVVLLALTLAIAWWVRQARSEAARGG